MDREIANKCSECDFCYKDHNGYYRCSNFDDAILETVNEKHCKDSMR